MKIFLPAVANSLAHGFDFPVAIYLDNDGQCDYDGYLNTVLSPFELLEMLTELSHKFPLHFKEVD